MINLNPILPQAASSGGTTPTTGNALPTSQGLNDMFMQLLMAQLKNQSPLNPMDPAQFVGQLAQFSELSVVTSIYQLLRQGAAASSGATRFTSGSSAATETNPSSGAVTSAILSSAASAAKDAIPNFTSSTASFFNRKVQGVF